MHRDVAHVLYDEQQIAQRVAELGAQITRDYAARLQPGESLVVMCTLRGAAIFTADLVRAIELPVETEYISASSYGNTAESCGEVDIEETLPCNISGRHVLVVEDMIDSGLTLVSLLECLRAQAPASLEAAVMLKKVREDGEGSGVVAEYIGFECPDEFLVGYGLDYAQHYRNLPYIGVLKPSVYK